MDRTLRYEAFFFLALALLFIYFLKTPKADRYLVGKIYGIDPALDVEPGGVGPGGIKMADLPGPEMDINRATVEELAELPGVGTALAERIYLKRVELNGFGSKEELKEVRGIGEIKFETLRYFVTVKE